MKQFKTIVISLILIILFSCETKSKKTRNTNKPNQVEVLDFYGKHRCNACISIEEKTRLTIETHFKEEVNKGILHFKVINIDEKENERITESYGAYGTSLFLNVIKDGKESHIDITDFAFKKENNQTVFIEELRLKIKTELSKL